jgi:hypothetical protein
MAYIPKLPPFAARRNSTVESHIDKILVTSVTPVTPIHVSTAESGAINAYEVSGLLHQWLRDECVLNWLFASNAKIMRREFRKWAGLPPSYDGAIADQLRLLGFTPNEDDMLSGLALAADFLAALQYERARTSLPANDGRTFEKGGTSMSLIVTTTPKQYELPDEGEHLAVLADVIDLGEVDTQYGKKDRVRFIWLVEQRDKEGKLIAVVISYTKSLHDKASLRKAVKAILGRDPGNSLDLETLLGTNMRLVIEHSEYEGRAFAAIAVMLRPRKGDAVLRVPSDFVRSKSPSGGGTPPNNGNNGPASQDSQQGERHARENRNKGKKQNINNTAITDADVQFPGDAA